MHFKKKTKGKNAYRAMQQSNVLECNMKSKSNPSLFTHFAEEVTDTLIDDPGRRTSSVTRSNGNLRGILAIDVILTLLFSTKQITIPCCFHQSSIMDIDTAFHKNLKH